jgi:hypothetical protein
MTQDFNREEAVKEVEKLANEATLLVPSFEVRAHTEIEVIIPFVSVGIYEGKRYRCIATFDSRDGLNRLILLASELALPLNIEVL